MTYHTYYQHKCYVRSCYTVLFGNKDEEKSLYVFRTEAVVLPNIFYLWLGEFQDTDLLIQSADGISSNLYEVQTLPELNVVT
jgi:hypothetical protein